MIKIEYFFCKKQKDGDYNKPIPEMEIPETNKKYCINENKQNYNSNQILCNKCNKNQELKLKKLSLFESEYNKNEVNNYFCCSLIFKESLKS
jgi:hypothetical protein